MGWGCRFGADAVEFYVIELLEGAVSIDFGLAGDWLMHWEAWARSAASTLLGRGFTIAVGGRLSRPLWIFKRPSLAAGGTSEMCQNRTCKKARAPARRIIRRSAE